MKIMRNFLFVEQSFTDTGETRTAIVNVNHINSITCQNCYNIGEATVIETNESKIITKEPDFPETFYELLEKELTCL